MTFNPLLEISVLVIFSLTLSYSAQTSSALRYQQVLDHIGERRSEISQHPFFTFLADGSIAPERRMQFAPYWTFFSLQAADIFTYWIRYENPRNALEKRVNQVLKEDDFHYNLLFHDVKALGYTIDRYGSFEAVIRHLWSDETHSIRQFFYHWAALTVMHRDDAMVPLTVFEAGEASISGLLGVTYKNIYLEGGMTELKYFGKEHVQFEKSHNETAVAWFGKKSQSPEETFEAEEKEENLADIEITEEQKQLYIEVADGILDRYVQTSRIDCIGHVSEAGSNASQTE